MVRAILTAVAALSILADSAAGAQTTNTPPPPVPDHTAPDNGELPDICVADLRINAKIIVGRGRKKIRIQVDSGTCGEPQFSILTAAYATDSSKMDAIESENCRAYRTQIHQLPLARDRKSHGAATIKAVRAGPFTITDNSHLFELRSANGQKAAARWIRQTLVAVRPCWNNFRQDHTREVVNDLYRTLPMKPR
ncbi:MAG: hypothetical protein ABIS51_14245 [Sphingomonas sp.]